MKKLFFAVLVGSLIGLAADAASTHGNEKNAYRAQQYVLQDDAVSLVGAGPSVGSGIKLFDLPEGNIIVHGLVADVLVTCTGVVAGESLLISVGTASNANGALASTETNLGHTATAFTSGVTRSQWILANPLRIDGTAAAADFYLNVATTNITATNVSASVVGQVQVLWSYVGDY